MVAKVLGGTLIIIVVGGASLYALAQSERTVCFAHFHSEEPAELAADQGRDAGFDADVDARRATYYAVTFETGETDEDARELRASFAQIVEQNDGGLGHPGGGCLEKPYLD